MVLDPEKNVVPFSQLVLGPPRWGMSTAMMTYSNQLAIERRKNGGKAIYYVDKGASGERTFAELAETILRALDLNWSPPSSATTKTTITTPIPFYRQSRHKKY